MYSVYRILVLLVSLVMVSQPVFAAGLAACHEQDSVGHEHSGSSSSSHVMVHDHNDGDPGNPSHLQSCDCGNYCAGTCMHGCQGHLLISGVVLLVDIFVIHEVLLTNTISLPAIDYPLLRPPIIS